MQAMYGLLLYFSIIHTGGNSIVGSFDNTAGYASCLAFSIPLCLRDWRVYSRWTRCVIILTKVVCIVAILFSESRAGMLCLVACGIMILPYLRAKKRVVLPIALIVATLCLGFGMKGDSSRGRWFIIQRTAEMIAERPLTGWGHGGYDAHYMDMQAEYFVKYPDSSYVMLADNIHHPLNEFLFVAVEFGVIGLLVVLGFIVFVALWYRRHPSELGKTGLRLMVCVIIFSTFSYPFLYPYTWLITLYAIYCVFSNAKMHCLIKRTAATVTIIVLPLVGWYAADRLLLYRDWSRIHEKAYRGQSRKMMPEYARLYPALRKDIRFLYNYAAEQYNAGLFKEALLTAEECQENFADYDLALLLADIHRALRQNDKALLYYQKANMMCPSRFIPLYEQYCIYNSIGDWDACARLATVILNKPIKIWSQETLQIIEEVSSMEDISKERIKASKEYAK